MNIREFTFNLIKLYEEMAETFSDYQSQSGLHCLKNCGRCCLNPDIEASPLEMFPLALKVYDEGKLDEWLHKLENNSQSHCVLYVPTGIEGEGRCGFYSERPAVCRMFGVAGTFDKHREVRLSICKYIKENQPIVPEVNTSTPLIPEWSSKLMTLDPELVQKKLPINIALKEALQRIAFCAQYQQL
jgi:Fe-S-cluster containining protein